MADEYIINLKANTKDAESAIEGFGSSVVSVAKKAGAAFAGFLVVKEIAQFLKEGVNEAIQTEEAINSLNRSLQSIGKYSDEASISFATFAKSLQQTTGIADDVIIKNASMLVSLGKLSSEGLERATVASADLAAFMGTDIASAMDLVTKAANGNVGALKKYGLEIQKGSSDSQVLAQTLKFIEERMGGTAAQNVNTFSGATKQLGLSLDDVSESFGEILVKSPAVIAFIKTLAKSFNELANYISELNLAQYNMRSVINFGLAFTYVVVSLVERIVSFITAVGGLFNYIVYGVFGPLEQAIGKILGGIGAALQAVLPNNIIATTFQQWGADLANLGQQTSAFAQGSLATAGNEIKNTFAGITQETGTASAAIIDFQAKFDAAMMNMSKSSKNANDNLGKDIKKTAKQVEISGAFIGGSFQTLVTSMVSSMKQGQGLFANLGQKMMSIFGDIAIQVGQVLVGIGIGMISLGSLSPFAAIAAGLGLITIGVLLKATYGGATDGAGSGTAASGAGGASENVRNATSQDEEVTGFVDDRERVGPNTGVQVIVQGNVFDNRETGLAIAEIINESFYNNGTTVMAT